MYKSKLKLLKAYAINRIFLTDSFACLFCSMASAIARRVSRLARNPDSARALYSGNSPYRVSLCLRRDDSRFAGPEGAALLRCLYSLYKKRSLFNRGWSMSALTNHIDVMTPQNIDLARFLEKDINLSSGVALYVDGPSSTRIVPHSVLHSKAKCGTETASYSGFMHTHIIYGRNTRVPGFIDSCRVPFRVYADDTMKCVPALSHIDTWSLTDENGEMIDIDYNVVIATDRELGIDEEWERIVAWARRS